MTKLLIAMAVGYLSVSSTVAAQDAATATTRVVLLVDSSSGTQAHFQRMRPALTEFINALPPEIEVAFISTGGQLRVRVPPTTDHAKLTRATEGFAPDGGGNAFLDAMLEADQRFLKKETGKKSVFVIVSTDSETRNEPHIDEYNKFVNDFRQRRGMAHAVVIRGSNQMGLASQVLENVTQNTGGTYQVMALPNGLSDALKQIAARVATGR